MQYLEASRDAGTRRSVKEWEQYVGDRIRQIRLARNVSQSRMAHLADVSVGTVHNLESGSGSSLSTLVKVLRALGEERWLTELQQPSSFDPVAAFEQREREQHSRRHRAAPSSSA